MTQEVSHQFPDPDFVTSRELDARMAEVRRAVDLATDTAGSTVELREYVEALFNEQQRATEIAERERSKAADALFAESRRASELADRERAAAANALREEQRRATEMAERERSKAADALAVSLAQSIREGDERLREHIANQVRQIEAALTSAQNLSTEQIHTLESDVSALEQRSAMRHEQMQEQMVSRFDYTEKAVAKAEDASEKRFESVNEFRAQLSDQTQTLMPRREVETLLAELSRQIGENRDNLSALRTSVAVGPPNLTELQTRADILAGQQQAVLRHQDRVQPWMVWALGAMVSVVILVVNLLIKLH